MRLQYMPGTLHVLLGSTIIVLSLVAYSAYVNSIPILDVRTANQLEGLAYAVLVLTIAGLGFAVFGAMRTLRSYRTISSTSRTIASIGRVLDTAKYRQVMTGVTLAYGLVFAFVSGIIVYRPAENFSAEYLARIPPSIVAVCCGFFTACPTCAGLLLSETLLSVGFSAAMMLSSLQPFFILARFSWHLVLEPCWARELFHTIPICPANPRRLLERRSSVTDFKDCQTRVRNS